MPVEYVVTKGKKGFELRCWCCHNQIPLSPAQMRGEEEIVCGAVGCGYRETRELQAPAAGEKLEG